MTRGRPTRRRSRHISPRLRRSTAAGALAALTAIAALSASGSTPLAVPPNLEEATPSASSAPQGVPRARPGEPLEVEPATDAEPPSSSEPPVELPADLPPEVRSRIIEAAVIEALRNDLYFSDAIRMRLAAPGSIRLEVRRAAAALALDDAETRETVKRADSPEGRASLVSLLPEHDDPDALRTLMRRDLLRLVAPAQGESRLSDHASKVLIASAVRLLVERMDLPGGRAIWGKVDDEVDRKIRSIIASRAPRPERRAWCEFAAWTLLGQGLDERSLGVAVKCAEWIANADQPPSVDLAAVRALSLHSMGLTQEAARLFAEDPALAGAPAELRERLERALSRSTPPDAVRRSCAGP